MKLLHTADWHLGKKLNYISRLPEQEAVLEEICQIASQTLPDAILIAGDIFDTSNPPIEALELFYRTARRLSRDGKCAIIGIAGNHDSPDRIEAPDPLARACGILLTGYPESEIKPFTLESGLQLLRADKGFIELKLPACDAPLRVILTPYANEMRLRRYLGQDDTQQALQNLLENQWKQIADTYCDTQGVNVLMTHLFMMKNGAERPEESEGEKSVLSVGGAKEVFTHTLPSQMQYVALGHIHRPQTIDNDRFPVVYSGSPLEYSMSEIGQQKSVVLIEAAPGKPVEMRKMPLLSGRKLVRITFDSVDEAEEWLKANPHTIVEMTLHTRQYLTPTDRKRLLDAHECLFINLQLTNPALTENGMYRNIDLTRPIESLFVDYFQHKKQQIPNDQLLEIFREIVNEEE